MMKLNYIPSAENIETFHFDFPIHHSRKIAEYYSHGEILGIYAKVVKQSYPRGGIDRIQKIQDLTSGKVIAVIAHLSEEQKEEILNTFENPVKYLRENIGTTIIFEDEL